MVPGGKSTWRGVAIKLVINTPSAQVRGLEAAPVASLSVVAAVEHMRNGYSGRLLNLGKLPVEQALVFY